jgi:hypothetical protein
MKRPCIYILFRIFLIILANRSFGQEQLIEKEDKNDSLLLVHFENIIQKYKPNELELFRSKIKNIDLEEGTIKYLEALSVKKLYQPDSVVVLPLLMVHSTQKLFRDSVLNLKLNTFDTLYTFLSDEFSGYLFKKKKYYEATVYLVQCLLPYKKMYGEKSKHFIKSLIKMGDYGLSMTERLNSFNDYMVFPKILLEEYHQNTQFYIDMYAYITKIYFQKHIYSSMEDSGSKTLIAISNNKSLQTDKNVDLISKIAYYFYSFESAFDTQVKRI